MPSPAVLVKISRGFHVTSAAFEKQVGRSLTQWRILYLLSRCGPSTQKFLTSVTRVDAGSITRASQALEEEGLLTRIQHPSDNRLRIVELTEKGRAEFQSLLGKRKSLMQIMMAGVEPEDLAGFDRVLTRIESNLTEAIVPDA
jgi:DNA-binding MarR family transcriptional regulator